MDSIFDMIGSIEAKYGSRCAFRWHDPESDQIESRTYHQFASDVRRFAVYLKTEYPDVQGKHIGILAENSYRHIVAIFGILMAGAVLSEMSPRETLEQIRYQIDCADLTLVMHDGQYLESHPEFAQYSDMLCLLEVYESCEAQLELTDCEDPNALAMLMFTSGTTGKSKCVMISRKSMFVAVKGLGSAAKSMSSGRLTSLVSMLKTVGIKGVKGMAAVGKATSEGGLTVLMMNPLSHVSGVASIMTGMHMGYEFGLCLEIKYLYRDLRDFQSMHMMAVPMVLKMFARDLKRGKPEKLANLKFLVAGAAKVDTEDYALFQKQGITVFQAYGMTEIFGGGTTNRSYDPKKAASIGIPSATVEVKVEDGEICFRSEAVMMGYYKNPEATAETLVDGWLHTGDLGYIDKDGFVYLTGRKKNLIILDSGENVSPEELEALLDREPLIAEALVKEKNGKICAEIYCKQTDREKVSERVNEINRGLAFFKRMTELEFRTEPFARTSSGKIKR